jgi:hypothetical protein
MNRKIIIPVFLILGIVFFTIGWATDQDVYFYIAIPFLVISFFGSSFRRRK